RATRIVWTAISWPARKNLNVTSTWLCDQAPPFGACTNCSSAFAVIELVIASSPSTRTGVCHVQLAPAFGRVPTDDQSGPAPGAVATLLDQPDGTLGDGSGVSGGSSDRMKMISTALPSCVSSTGADQEMLLSVPDAPWTAARPRDAETG